ncbi:hypothetical protein PUV47_13350 [Pseudovibrio exalbescens]|uniref:hypothetical protein n=1 Tax=Pseudovibrio exalbescens TaxID=197461 RepID=UPI0023657DB6|nr:hypothetical protein [Pseudovibrio exalbescens]MDD7910908.1 hypothetical protein [Pseudovibrio exalbescens]
MPYPLTMAANPEALAPGQIAFSETFIQTTPMASSLGIACRCGYWMAVAHLPLVITYAAEGALVAEVFDRTVAPEIFKGFQMFARMRAGQRFDETVFFGSVSGWGCQAVGYTELRGFFEGASTRFALQDEEDGPCKVQITENALSVMPL